MKKKILLPIVSVVAVAVVTAVVFAIGAYGFSWRGAFARTVLKTVPYPVVIANTTWIPLNDFYEDQETISHYLQQTAPDQPRDENINSSLLNRLVYDSVLAGLAKKNDVEVTEADMETKLKEIVDAQEGDESLDTILTNLYGWNTEQFKKKILVPFIQQEKLTAILAADDVSAVRQRAEEALAAVQNGDRSFEDVAKEYSEDTTASLGGDLGYFGRGQMVQAFEDAAFALNAGEVSGIVESEFGFHIIKVEEKITDESKGEQVHARHILLKRPTVDALIAEEMKNATVRVFLTGFQWNTEKNWIEKKES